MTIEAVWSQYRQNIKAFLHSKVSDATDVEDLLQEILIKTHNKLDTVRDDENVRAWLFRVAHNAIIDFYRERAKARNIDPDDLWYRTADESIETELSKCVAPFVRALPEDDRRLLTAIDLEGQSQKRYAEEHGISYSTLKSRVHKARIQLRHLFDQCCQFTLDKSGKLVEFIPKSRACEDC